MWMNLELVRRDAVPCTDYEIVKIGAGGCQASAFAPRHRAAAHFPGASQSVDGSRLREFSCAPARRMTAITAGAARALSRKIRHLQAGTMYFHSATSLRGVESLIAALDPDHRFAYSSAGTFAKHRGAA